jgi:hypothetical protein
MSSPGPALRLQKVFSFGDMTVTIRSPLILILCLLVSSPGWGASIIDATGASSEVTEKSFARYRLSKGVVLLDVNWGRRWSCGGYENAELRGLAFDRLPSSRTAEGEAADLTLVQGASLLTKPTFVSYAALVDPGEYALSGFDIEIARSASDISHWVAKRSELLKDGKALGGTFKVAAGETVYIGNFFLDCHQGPLLWRYYTEGTAAFRQHLQQYKREYPFLDVDAVVYRLFETTTLGTPYELK